MILHDVHGIGLYACLLLLLLLLLATGKVFFVVVIVLGEKMGGRGGGEGGRATSYCLCLRGFLNFLSMDSYGYIIPLVYVGFSYN